MKPGARRLSADDGLAASGATRSRRVAWSVGLTALAVLLCLVWPRLATPSPKPPGRSAPAAKAKAAAAEASTESSDAGVPFGRACPMCKGPTARATVANPQVDEASGIVASAAHAGVYYVHNDSGDRARFFALDEHGAHLGTFNLDGVVALDWEDVARGPCPSGTCLYFADIGDNFKLRPSYALYRVPEPAVLDGGEHTLAGEVLPFHYPDGRHNAETLLIHPRTGVVTVVTKRWSVAAQVYEFPLPLAPGKNVELIWKGELHPPMGSNQITGGDVHPLGEAVLLRTYSHVWYYPMRADEPVAVALARRPCAMPGGELPNGEAIAWFASGEGYVTLSEGRSPVLVSIACRP